ncbi:TPA: hypothetical protein RNX34_002152 [Pasteurella multocida]|uniref:hypothetical protein n=1 Tax=Pasteurella multocida TaxID=747 RepID=UPI001093B39F|nr:hypothetical protein [Pasteurella multocida]QCA32162.1 hypothetical protein E5U06_09675 [Pasteurella multocida]QXG51766.1 hypothetical protein KSF84_01475 [Pasteurella multocida]WGE13651.1 hypothetical protein PM3_0279 [Pasteurella multocida]HDX0990418.1 hypothetical protein [Pasteurella multocida]HDX1015685.1 hypothetical protein [Pasteurella multocida]
MTFQQLGANFAKIAKFIDHKLISLPAFPRKILFSIICIIGVPFLVIGVLILKDWSAADINTQDNEIPPLNTNIEEGDTFSFIFEDEESYQCIEDGFHSSGPEGEGYYVDGFRMPENTDEDWL